MKKYKILGPFDRYNYGDLLFPLVLEKQLEENGASIEYYGLINSDLSFHGAKKTKSVAAFYSELEPDDKIIIAGGESLCTTWADLYSYLSPDFNKLYSFKPFRSIDRRLGYFSGFARNLAKGKTKYPFAVSPTELPVKQVGTYFNAVGGSALFTWSDSKLQNFCQRLKESEVIGVRDDVTFSKLQPYLKDSGNLFLTPDSAILMQQNLFEDKSRAIRASKLQSQIGDNYIFFQVGAEKTDNMVHIISNLERILKETKLDLVLCPIGYALGHDDLKPLTEIYDDLSQKFPGRIKIIKEVVNLFEIMTLIENATVYIGTSLHGAITSMSFGTPYVTFNKQIKKLANYLNTWGVCDLNTQYAASDIYTGFKKAEKVERNAILGESARQKTITKEFMEKLKI